MAGKIIDEDVLKLTVQNLTQLIADNVYEEIPYQDSEIDDMFDATTQEIDYYSSLISDTLVSENRIFSSRHVTDLLQQLQLDCNSYADEIATRTLTTEIVTATSEVTKENVLYLILSDSSTNTYEQYMLIGGTATPLGSTKIDLSDVYTKSEIDTKLDTKANKSEVLAVNKVQTTTGNETHDNVYSAQLVKSELDLKANKDEVVKKTDIKTTLDENSTNNDVYGGKAIFNAIKKNYSTDEKVVGTWVDGKPIYEKTIFSSFTNYTVGEYSFFNLPLDNVNITISIDGMVNYDSNYPVPVNYHFEDSSGNNMQLIATYYHRNTSSIKTLVYMASSTVYTNANYFVTIRYTKTTD